MVKDPFATSTLFLIPSYSYVTKRIWKLQPLIYQRHVSFRTWATRFVYKRILLVDGKYDSMISTSFTFFMLKRIHYVSLQQDLWPLKRRRNFSQPKFIYTTVHHSVCLCCSFMFSFAGRLDTSCNPSRDTLHRRNGRRSANAKWKTGVTSINFSLAWRLESKASMELTNEGSFEHSSIDIKQFCQDSTLVYSYVVFCPFSLIWIVTFISIRWYFREVLKKGYGENKNRDVWAKVFLKPLKKQEKWKVRFIILWLYPTESQGDESLSTGGVGLIPAFERYRCHFYYKRNTTWQHRWSYQNTPCPRRRNPHRKRLLGTHLIFSGFE